MMPSRAPHRSAPRRPLTLSRAARPFALLCGLLATTGVVACGDAIGSSAEFATDTWANPTEHGELEFGAKNPAEFTAEHRYHAWTFELTDDADVTLETQLVTQNLDSVMYLYKRGDNGRWGSYIAKNDDAAGLGLGSRVKKKLKAGTYQVKVKAAKALMTGTFTLDGACSGAGCPEVGSQCGPEDAAMPAATGYGPACAEKMHAILTTPIGPGAPACLADNLEERALTYYKDYWNDIYSWEEVSGGEEPTIDVSHHSGAGTIVRVDLGGDEDAMDYVFDAEGKLLFYYQHNQSPDWAWFCGGEASPSDPGETCASNVAGSSDYRVEHTREGSGSVTVAEADGLGPHVAGAIAEYAAETNLGASDAVDYAFVAWDAQYNTGADVQLSAAGKPAVGYTVTGEPEWGMTITFRTDANGTDFLCKDL